MPKKSVDEHKLDPIKINECSANSADEMEKSLESPVEHM